jgi:pSer/pThr/pTyr-binding forkhead associated (FHA) protein
MLNRIVAACGVLLVVQITCFAQGSLTPPGAPAPTMKTLSQVEPRTAITSIPFTITNSGSYYLGASLGNSPGSGIVIKTNDVVVDLNGFTLTGSFTGSGVFIYGGCTNVTVRNGTLRNWPSFGIDAYTTGGSYELLFEDLAFIQNTNEAVISLRPVTARRCTAYKNQGGGFDVIGGDFYECVARENGNIGMSIGSALGSFHNCYAVSNSNAGIAGYGAGNVFVDCVSRGNGGIGIAASGVGAIIRNCVSSDNGTGVNGSGITANIRATIEDCTIISNRADGINVGGDSVVRNCHVSNNGQGKFAAGINTTSGSGSRIEGNHVRDNIGYGISVSGIDVVVRNTVGNNSTNIAPASSLYIAPLQNPATVTNAWANVAY